MSNAPRVPARKKPAATGAFDFTSLVASKSRKSDNRFTMDMSRFWPEKATAESPILFTYRPFRMNQMFALEELIVFVKRQRPLWTNNQCLEVAALVACHIDPPARIGATPEENRAMLVPLYCQTFEDADDDGTDLYFFLQEFNEKSGGFLKNLQAAIEEKKKDLSPPKEPDSSEPSTSA